MILNEIIATAPLVWPIQMQVHYRLQIQRWLISPWPRLPGSGSMGTRMNSYHYLVETLEKYY